MKHFTLSILLLISCQCFSQVNGIESYGVRLPYIVVAIPGYLDQSLFYNNSNFIEMPGYRLRGSETEIWMTGDESWVPVDSFSMYYSNDNFKDQKFQNIPFGSNPNIYIYPDNQLYHKKFYLFDSLKSYKFSQDNLWLMSADMHQTIEDHKVVQSTFTYPLLNNGLIYTNFYLISQTGYPTTTTQFAFNTTTGQNDTAFQYIYGYDNNRLASVKFTYGAIQYYYNQKDRNYYFDYNSQGRLKSWFSEYKSSDFFNTFATSDSVICDYDPAGDITEIQYFYLGMPQENYLYTYTSGHLSSKERFHSLYDDSLTSDCKYQYTYDDSGKLDSIFYYSFNNAFNIYELSYIYLISYNERNLLSHISEYDMNPLQQYHLRQKYVYKYDERDNISSIRVKKRNFAGEMEELESYTYLYDKAGNFIYYEAVDKSAGYNGNRYKFYYEKYGDSSQVDEKDLSLSIYPNPAGNILNIYVMSSLNSTSDLTIYNALGEVVYQNFIDAKCDCRETIDISALSPGFYVVELSSGGLVNRQKLIVE